MRKKRIVAPPFFFFFEHSTTASICHRTNLNNISLNLLRGRPKFNVFFSFWFAWFDLQRWPTRLWHHHTPDQRRLLQSWVFARVSCAASWALTSVPLRGIDRNKAEGKELKLKTLTVFCTDTERKKKTDFLSALSQSLSVFWATCLLNKNKKTFWTWKSQNNIGDSWSPLCSGGSSACRGPRRVEVHVAV